VVATSACNAWAVGHYYNNQRGTAGGTLVERWNGNAWKVQKTPNPGGNSLLRSVAAVSARDAWAVGTDLNGVDGLPQSLVEHWNGRAWKVQKSPNLGGLGGFNDLYGVAAVSARDAWAVGGLAAVEHWNGRAWKVQKSPSLGGLPVLSGVAAVSARDAWAVGNHYDRATHATQTLIEHWNGKAWKVQKSPNPGGTANPYKALSGVAALSARDAWAVGAYGHDQPGSGRTLVERWNGNAWKG
jgi:hypothetical protein